MTTPEESLQRALAARGRDRHARPAEYLNLRARPAARPAAWLSEIGFYAALPFAYAEADASNVLPGDDEPRPVRRVELHLYGAARDHARLTSRLLVDQVVHPARADGQPGRALYPGDPQYLGAADLRDDTSAPEKTARLLGAMRAAGTGVAYHAVVTRAGAVYVTAPLDRGVPCGDAPDLNAEATVAVALEGACRALNREGRDAPADAPLTRPQLASLAVLLAKLRAAFPAIPAGPDGVRASAGPEGVLGGEDVWLSREPGALAALLAAAAAEAPYDVSREVYRATAPPPSRRAEAQAALGSVDTVGRASVLLGAYADVAAEDRAGAMQEPARTRFFVARARAAHGEGEDALALAARAGQASALVTPPPPARNTSPFVYDYRTGRWGDQGA